MASTIKDVAREAGVSISTVSRVLNNSKPVSDNIKRKVLEVVEELDYRPNSTARNLVMKKSNLIGVMVTDISTSFVGSTINAIEEIAKTYNYDVILCNSYGSQSQEEHYFELMRSKQVEGIILLTPEIREFHVNIIENMKIPTVIMNRDASESGLMSVTIDYESAFYEITNNLISLGHRKIAFLKVEDYAAVFGEEQLKGFKKAYQNNSIDIKESMIVDCGYKMSHAYDKMMNILKSENKRPTAILASTDDMVIGAMNAAIDIGLKIPEDISVYATYDSRNARILRPQLSSIVHPTYEIGAVAIRLIIKKISGNEENKLRFNLPYKIENRDSIAEVKNV